MSAEPLAVQGSRLRKPRLAWSKGMEPKPVISGVDASDVGQIVHDHAAAHASSSSWLSNHAGAMSPKITELKGAKWNDLQKERHFVLDSLTVHYAALDLKLLSALGEPRYWPLSGRKPDEHAASSRFDMQPRNSGASLLSTKFKTLAEHVSSRDPASIVDGLSGTYIRNAIGHNSPVSRTATAFRGPGPTDNAVTSCAMWGISQFALTQRTKEPRHHIWVLVVRIQAVVLRSCLVLQLVST